MTAFSDEIARVVTRARTLVVPIDQVRLRRPGQLVDAIRGRGLPEDLYREKVGVWEPQQPLASHRPTTQPVSVSLTLTRVTT